MSRREGLDLASEQPVGRDTARDGQERNLLMFVQTTEPIDQLTDRRRPKASQQVQYLRLLKVRVGTHTQPFEVNQRLSQGSAARPPGPQSR